MRIHSCIVAGLLAASLCLAQGEVPVGKADLNKATVAYNGPRP